MRKRCLSTWTTRKCKLLAWRDKKPQDGHGNCCGSGRKGNRGKAARLQSFTCSRGRDCVYEESDGESPGFCYGGRGREKHRNPKHRGLRIERPDSEDGPCSTVRASRTSRFRALGSRESEERAVWRCTGADLTESNLLVPACLLTETVHHTFVSPAGLGVTRGKITQGAEAVKDSSSVP